MKFSYMDETKEYNERAIADLIKRLERQKVAEGYQFGKGLQAMLAGSGATSGSRATPSKKPTEKPSQTYGGKWRGPTGDKPDPALVTSEKHWPDGTTTYICRGGRVVYVP